MNKKISIIFLLILILILLSILILKQINSLKDIKETLDIQAEKLSSAKILDTKETSVTDSTMENVIPYAVSAEDLRKKILRIELKNMEKMKLVYLF